MRRASRPRGFRKSEALTLHNSPTEIGFVNYQNGNGGDYHLLPSSPAKGAASDGSDLGANVDAVLTAISGVKYECSSLREST